MAADPNWEKIAEAEACIITELTDMVDQLIYMLRMYCETTKYEKKLNNIKKRIEEGPLL